MGCNNCRSQAFNQQAFKQKLGRCRQCMWQLTLLSGLSWGAWWYFYRTQPAMVESITLIFAASAFSLLLAAHLLVAFIRRLRNTNRDK
ncbi:DUF3624 domain-containing protein [Photobacterium sagamiensis]|uniref:DUF3624 domain-containing protein n=1 Tax=Photobacterium sagamiensis TaxID=2910241 RepID=UPI003D135998